MEKETKIVGICLNTIDYKENDKIIYLLTPEGKISALMRGVKKSNSKLKFVCQPFCYSEFLFTGKGSMPLVINANIIDNNFDLLNTYKVYEISSIVLKIIYALSNQIQDSLVLFDCVINFFKGIKNIDESKLSSYLNTFLLDILKISGYGIDIDQCSYCGKPIVDNAYFDIANSSFFCKTCNNSNDNYELNKDCIEFIRNLHKDTYIVDENVDNTIYVLLKKCFKNYFNFEI